MFRPSLSTHGSIAGLFRPSLSTHGSIADHKCLFSAAAGQPPGGWPESWPRRRQELVDTASALASCARCERSENNVFPNPNVLFPSLAGAFFVPVPRRRPRSKHAPHARPPHGGNSQRQLFKEASRPRPSPPAPPPTAPCPPPVPPKRCAGRVLAHQGDVPAGRAAVLGGHGQLGHGQLLVYYPPPSEENMPARPRELLH